MTSKLRYRVVFIVVVTAMQGVTSMAGAELPSQNGNTYVTTPDCLRQACETKRGATILAHARFVDPNVGLNSYNLYLSVEPWCTPSLQNHRLGGPWAADANGQIPGAAGLDYDGVADGDGTLHTDAPGTIPISSSTGTYDVCFNNAVFVTPGSSSTYPVALTVKR